MLVIKKCFILFTQNATIIFLAVFIIFVLLRENPYKY